MPIKPATKPEWTVGNPDFALKTIEPDAAKKESGWNAAERPPHQFMNWLLYNLGTEWLNYFEDITDILMNIPQEFVGDSGTYPFATRPATTAGLQAALDNAPVGAIIWILEDVVLTSKVQVTKAKQRIVSHPRATISKGAGTIGIEVLATAEDFQLFDSRLAGWNTGGDIAVKLITGTLRTMIKSCYFIDNDTHIDDAAGTVVYVDSGNYKD